MGFSTSKFHVRSSAIGSPWRLKRSWQEACRNGAVTAPEFQTRPELGRIYLEVKVGELVMELRLQGKLLFLLRLHKHWGVRRGGQDLGRSKALHKQPLVPFLEIVPGVVPPALCSWQHSMEMFFVQLWETTRLGGI